MDPEEKIIYPQDAWGWKISQKTYFSPLSYTTVIYRFGKLINEFKDDTRICINHLVDIIKDHEYTARRVRAEGGINDKRYN